MRLNVLQPLGLLTVTLICTCFPPSVLSTKKVTDTVNNNTSKVTVKSNKGGKDVRPRGDKESPSTEEKRRIVPNLEDLYVVSNRLTWKTRERRSDNIVHLNLNGRAIPRTPVNLIPDVRLKRTFPPVLNNVPRATIVNPNIKSKRLALPILHIDPRAITLNPDVRSKRIAPPLLHNYLRRSVPKNMSMNAKEFDIPLSSFDKMKLTPQEKNLLLSLQHNTTTREKLPLKRQGIIRPYPDADLSYDEEEGHNILRRRLLQALSRRIEARNMLTHEKALLRQRMLQDRLLEARNHYSGVPDASGLQRYKVLHPLDRRERMGEGGIDFPVRREPPSHEIGSFVERNPEPDYLSNNINDFNTESYRGQPLVGGVTDRDIRPSVPREQELLSPFNDGPLPRHHLPRVMEGDGIPTSSFEPYGREPNILRSHVSRDFRSRDPELLLPSEGEVRRADIGKYGRHNLPLMDSAPYVDDGAYDANLQQQSDSIFEQPRVHAPSPYESQKSEMMHRIGEGDSMLPRSDMYRGNTGNLGDETLPYGSLGSSKDRNMKMDMITDPMMHRHTKVLPPEDVDVLRADRLPKEKKTWVTDVNVYSKKKKIDEIADLFSSDDDESDALDEYDPCEKKPCQNAGMCKIVGNTRYKCVCPRTHRGQHCGTRNHCHPNPCAHGSKCTEIFKGFKCSCVSGFKGKRCRERNYCLPNPCAENGVCMISTSPDKYACSCKDEWHGKKCEQKKTACSPNPCMNDGKCLTDGTKLFQCLCVNGSHGKLCEAKQSACAPNPCKNSGKCLTDGKVYECACATGFSGELCEERKGETSLDTIAHTFNIAGTKGDNNMKLSAKSSLTNVKSSISFPPAHEIVPARESPCISHPCLNGGSCLDDTTTAFGFKCDCTNKYFGEICEEKKCMCKNGGTCIGEGVEEKCLCKGGYGGTKCEEHTQCNEDTCLHGGICIEEVGGFKCKCDNGFKGLRCEEEDRCRPNPCLHGGTCKNYGAFHQCECSKGFKGKQCEDLDLCEPNPCQNSGQCFSYSGGYTCECNDGFSGKDCAGKRHCISNPCSNGAECIEITGDADNPEGSYKCGCRAGYTGKKCDTEDFCHNMPCHNGGKCTNSNVGYVCSCAEQYSGPQCQLFNHCYQKPCGRNGKCISTLDAYKCECDVGYKGDRCIDVDYCQPNPCRNNGFCTSNEANDGFVCHCSEGYQGLACTEPDPCYPNPCAHGNCSDVAGGFVCKCTIGFKGATCNDIDRCDPNPCFHGGNCEEINGGEGFTCLCNTGYKGKMCEGKDLCNPNPCHNDGLCEEFAPRDSLGSPYNRQHRYSKKYNAMSEYERDIIEGEGGVECTCMKGYHGKRCDEVDPCYPNPCLHESTCQFGGHFPIKCNCSTGWKGEHCHVVDLCQPDPCRYGTHCRQNDEESYQCVRSLCSPNPCSNGGKCIVVNDESYECACPKGYKGALCEESDSCQPNPCNNDGICRNTLEGKSECVCRPEYQGQYCDAKVDRGERNSVPEKKEKTKSYCHMVPCKNGGSCIDTESGFTCRCTYGFAGPFCEDSVCFPSPCNNDGICVPYYGIALCKCLSNYTGAHCSENKLANSQKPYNFNVKDVKNVQSVAKSQTPHILSQQLKNLDPTSPALIARVEEILNSYNDPVPSLLQQQQQAAILQNALATNPLLAAQSKIASLLGKPLNQSIVESPLQSNVRNELPAVPIVPMLNAETGRQVFSVPVSSSTILNPMLSPTTSMNPASLLPPVQPTVGIVEPSDVAMETSETKSTTSSEEKETKKKKPPHTSAKDEAKFETVGSVPETNPKLRKEKKKPTLAIDVIASSTKNAEPEPEKSKEAPISEHMVENDKFESVGSVPDRCEPNPCRHGGTCVIRSNGDPECICTENFSGPECRDVGKLGYSSGPKFFPHDECNHCDKEAICVNKHCICDKGFVGDGLECWPETTMDRKWDCDPNPCQNGGTCKKGRARCVCRLGFIGLFCEDYCEPCVHLSFDKTNGPYIIDESGHHNNAIMKNGAFIANNGGKCDSGVSPSGGDVLFGGKHFAPKPYDAITLVAWIKVDTTSGIQSIFDTVGGTLSTHREGQYHLEVDNNRIRWFHRNERHNTIFSVTSGAVVHGKNWTHIAGTYNAAKRLAMLYVNGDLVGTNTNVGTDVNLSQDWDTKAGLGRHEHTFGNRVFHGVIDEFYIFPCTLPRLEILVLMHHCKVYWKHKKKAARESLKRPQDPIFDIDTALQTEKPGIKAENVIALSETAKALEKDLKKFQSYYGLNKKEFEKHGRKEIETTGDSRFQISKPAAPKAKLIARPPPPAAPPAARGYKKNQGKKVKAAEYMSVMPNGPTSMVAEVQGLLTTELGNKRMQISPNKRLPGGKSLIAKNNPVTFAKYHRAPVVRNENKILPFGPHAYFQQPNFRQGPMAKSSFPHQPYNINSPRSKPNPRWFSWTKGLATTNGVTTTNTHSNSNQKEPGKVKMGNHVSSSQQSGGETEIKQRYGIPQSAYYNHAAPHANVNAQKVEQARRRLAAQGYAAKRQQMMAAQRKAAAIRNAQMARRYNPALRKKDEDEGEVETQEHKHQWGFGNGNGNGHGVGTPGASGSGGGWGAGGPINGKVNFPNWNPGQGRFTIPAPPRVPLRPRPQVTRAMWNTFLAQKRQSHTDVNAQTENTAQSVVNIEPAGGITNGKVSGHQWGNGNGNGQGTGGGAPGGEGHGGGWGTGGPTKQETWLPPGQGPPPSQRKNFIHSSTLPIAIAQSFKAPWLPQSSDKINNAHALSSQPDRRGPIFPPFPPYQYPNAYQVNEARRSGIPVHPMAIPSVYRVPNPHVAPVKHSVVQQRRIIPQRLVPPQRVNNNYHPPQRVNNYNYQLRNLQQNNYPYNMHKQPIRSQPLALVKHFSVPRPPVQRAQYHAPNVPPPRRGLPPNPQSRSHIPPFVVYQQKNLYSVSRPPYRNPAPQQKRTVIPNLYSVSRPPYRNPAPQQKRTVIPNLYSVGRPPYRNPAPQQKRTVIPRVEKPDPLSKHMTPQGIIETLPFLKKREIFDKIIL